MAGFVGRLRAFDWKAVPRVFWAELASLVRGRMVRALLPAIAVLAAVAALRAPPPAPPAKPREATASALSRLDRVLRRSRTTAAAVARSFRALRLLAPERASPELLDLGSRVVDAYYRTRFAGHPPNADEIQALDRALLSLSRNR